MKRVRIILRTMAVVLPLVVTEGCNPTLNATSTMSVVSAGASAGTTYNACTDNMFNVNSCLTAVSRYVTPTLCIDNVFSVNLCLTAVSRYVTPTLCTDNILNTKQCLSPVSRYITSTLGVAVSGSNASLTATIPQGYYSGSQTATMSDTNLVASNIAFGCNYFRGER